VIFFQKLRRKLGSGVLVLLVYLPCIKCLIQSNDTTQGPACVSEGKLYSICDGSDVIVLTSGTHKAAGTTLDQESYLQSRQPCTNLSHLPENRRVQLHRRQKTIVRNEGEKKQE
jgi:hypothetical protein